MMTTDTRAALVARLYEIASRLGTEDGWADAASDIGEATILLARSAPEERGEGLALTALRAEREFDQRECWGLEEDRLCGENGEHCDSCVKILREIGSMKDLALASPSAPAQEPDAWLAEVYFKGAWGAPALYRHQGDAEEYNRFHYEDFHPTRVVPLYRAPPVAQGAEEPKRRNSGWADPLAAAFYWMAPGDSASPEEMEEYERDRAFVVAALRRAPGEPEIREGWAVERGVTCVTCPECAFSFGAEHQDADGGYACPLCHPTAPQGLPREEEGGSERYEVYRADNGYWYVYEVRTSGAGFDHRCLTNPEARHITADSAWRALARPVAGSEEREGESPEALAELISRLTDASWMRHPDEAEDMMVLRALCGEARVALEDYDALRGEREG